MLMWTIILFAVAALGGLALAAMHFGGRQLPMSLALIHGIVAATALVILLIFALGATGPAMAKGALAGFVVAALGGFLLFSYHVRKLRLPSSVVVIHALVAGMSFVALLMVAVRH